MIRLIVEVKLKLGSLESERKALGEMITQVYYVLNAFSECSVGETCMGCLCSLEDYHYFRFIVLLLTFSIHFSSTYRHVLTSLSLQTGSHNRLLHLQILIGRKKQKTDLLELLEAPHVFATIPRRIYATSDISFPEFVVQRICIKIIKNEVGCRDNTMPKTVDTRKHCEED